MQTSRVVVLAGLLLASTLTDAVSVSSAAMAEAYATSWVKEHANPSGDELAELKTENPTAYALVKALLTKRSLGLLDPRHPTASFAAPPKGPEEDSHPVGEDAFAKFAKPGELKMSASASEEPPVTSKAMYPEVAGGQHHDWLNWRPQQSAMDDDSMVKSVLGAVAELKGKSAKPLLARHRSDSSSPLAADEMEMDLTEDSAPAVQPLRQSAPLEPVAPQPMVASSTLDLNLNTVSKDVQEENPYTAALGYAGKSAAQAQTPKSKDAPDSALGNWLGVKSSVQVAKTTVAPQAENPYLMALN